MSICRTLLHRALVLVLPLALLVLYLNAPAASAQSKASVFHSDDLHVRVTQADRTAAQNTTHVYKHPYFARTPVGLAARHEAARPLATSSAKFTITNAGNDFSQNPGDVTFQGGPTVLFAVSHAVYINPGGLCPIVSRCMGDNESILDHVGQ